MDNLAVHTIRRYVPLTQEEEVEVASYWHKHSVRKNEFLCKQGHIEDYFYIVESGVQRMFFETEDDEICIGFSYDKSWSGCFDSFVSGKPSRFSLQALSDSTLMRIHRKDMQTLYTKFKSMERFGRLMLEELLIARSIREIEMMSLSAEDRYKQFMSRSPHLLQLVAQKHLASYLRMTPETFSRCRALY